MMDWTDRHCRYFHRQLSHHSLLYTEMVVADAVIHGPRERLLGFNAIEHPLALQLGGSDPEKLAMAAQIGVQFGYDEINLNVGCPSDRVQSGTFGACLMRTPELVAQCVEAIKAEVNIPVTVKSRIGVDEQDIEIALDELAERVFAAGCDALWVHARKAWLEGLSPKENRDVPPLDYGRVYRLKLRYPDKFIGINGGIATLRDASEHLLHLDGVMIGRAAYHDPLLLCGVDSNIYKSAVETVDIANVIDVMADYAGQHIATGGKLSHITRHMLGLFLGQPGARRFRQILSEDAPKLGAGPDVLHNAFSAIKFARAA
jgi:tRNA-dihydrouridine synthase A